MFTTHAFFSRQYIFELAQSMLPRYLDLSEILVCLKLSLVKVKPDGSFTAVTSMDNAAVVPYIQDVFWKGKIPGLRLVPFVYSVTT